MDMKKRRKEKKKFRVDKEKRWELMQEEVLKSPDLCRKVVYKALADKPDLMWNLQMLPFTELNDEEAREKVKILFKLGEIL